MNPGEISYWQAGPGAEWVKVKVLVPFGNSVPGVVAVLLRLVDNTRIVIYRDGSVREGLPA